MNYNQFLLNKLMCLYNKSFDSLPYDLQFNHTIKLWEDFKTSDFDNPNIGIYECVEDYLKSNKEFITYLF